MGFIHETDSDIFGIETRSESAYLNDGNTADPHLFIPTLRIATVKDTIKTLTMKKAGEAFAKGDDKEANRLKDIANFVHTLPLEYLDREVRCFEATYKWIAELYRFIQSNDKLRTELGVE